jgi:hypothetical protein
MGIFESGDKLEEVGDQRPVLEVYIGIPDLTFSLSLLPVHNEVSTFILPRCFAFPQAKVTGLRNHKLKPLKPRAQINLSSP